MAKLLADYVEEVKTLCQDEDGALGQNTSVVEAQIGRGVRILSRKYPHVTVLDQIGDGSAEYYTVPTDWSPGFSTVLNVWYPFVVADDDSTEQLDREDFDVYEYSTGVWKFRLLDDTPGATEYSRWQYTSLHTVTDAASTIDSNASEDAVIWLATSFCLEIMAAKAVSVRNSGMGSEAVDYQGRSAQYLSLAKQYRAMSGLGEFLGETETQKGTAYVLQDLEPRPGGREWITHTGTAY